MDSLGTVSSTGGINDSMAAMSADLESRIAAGKAWIESGEGLIFDGPALRKFGTRVSASEFLDTPPRGNQDRKECYGLSFRVTIIAPRGEKGFQLNVRIKAGLTVGPKIESVPYVVVYVIDPSEGREESIYHDDLNTHAYFKNLIGLSDIDWYKKWVFRAIRTESGKFFKYATPT